MAGVGDFSSWAGMTEGLVVCCAVGSAMAAAASSVAQHRSARHAPRTAATSKRLFAHLLATPAWWLGLTLAAVGLALHAVALDGGRLAFVQPLLVTGLLFALPASLIVEGRRPSLRMVCWAVAWVVALAAFLVVARPRGGTISTDAGALAWTAAAGCALGAVLAWHGLRLPYGAYRAASLASASGVGYGVAAALLKQTTANAAGGAAAVLTDWPLYAFVVIGALAIALTQLAYRAGPLGQSMPALTIADPASSIAIGAVAFHEELSHSAAAITLEVVAFVVMGVASARLAR
jgi:hypothetical protein